MELPHAVELHEHPRHDDNILSVAIGSEHIRRMFCNQTDAIMLSHWLSAESDVEMLGGPADVVHAASLMASPARLSVTALREMFDKTHINKQKIL